MKPVLVDTSIWIDYFRGGQSSTDLDGLISENLVVTNELILAELCPLLNLKKQHRPIELLHQLKCAKLDIDWAQLTSIKTQCLKSGANGIELPDLVIAQNARQHDLQLFSLDRHFRLINGVYKLELYKPVQS